jgi:alkane 1-monooxygenase
MNIYALGFLLPWAFAIVPLFTLGHFYAGIVGIASFLVIALLELMLPPALSNVSDERAVSSQLWFKLILWGYVPLQTVVLAYAVWLSPSMSGWELAAAISAIGLVTGSIGITFAHELGHRRSKFERVLAHFLMASVGYGQFMIEHYRGHHARVATLDDPATARRGENVYSFWLRTIPGQFASAWALERERLGTTWSLRNLMLLHTAWAIAAPLLLWALLGPKAAIFWIGQSLNAILLLETVNYIEHYGILRNQQDGRAEPVNTQHAWNTYARPTNWMLVHLQRHADHHMYHGRPYPLLRAIRPAPELPTGYSGSILLALVPLLWFKLMHKKLDAMGAAPKNIAPIYSAKNSATQGV